MHLLFVNRVSSFVPGSFAIRFSKKGRVLGRKLVGLTMGGVVLCAGAISAAAQVAAEYRTAPRSLIVEKVDRSRMVPTVGAVDLRAARYQDAGPTDGSQVIEHMQFVLRRPAERQAAFDALAEALHTPGNPSFHRWLTPEIVGSEFGPSDADLATIKAYLEAEGFTVNSIGKGGFYVDFTGTVAQVESSFQTTFRNVTMQDGQVRYAAVRAASIPEALAPLVVGFASLSDLPHGHSDLRTAVSKPETLRGRPNDTVSTTEFNVGPQDFYTIYNENPLFSASTPITGAGVTIALLEETNIATGDIKTFRTTYGVSPATPVSFVVDQGYPNGNTVKNSVCTNPGVIAGEEGEATLDTEWAGAVAPKANLLFISCKAGTVLGTVYAGEIVIDNNLADVMSMSYGEYENYNTTQDTLVAQLWEQAASQGQTVVISAGDTGAASEDGLYGDSYAEYGDNVSGLASTAWNVSAGGTDFLDGYNTDEADAGYEYTDYWNSTNGTGNSSAKSYIPETTWNDSCGSSIYANLVGFASPEIFCGTYADQGVKINRKTYDAGAFAAGGGGTSVLHALPSWQNGTVYGAPTSGNRMQPDVSLFASNGWWGHALDYYETAGGGAGLAGGTSFVAPQLAGVFALIKQATGERLGQPNYVLYAMAGIEFGTSSYTTNSCNGSGATGFAPSSSNPSTSCIFYDVESSNIALPCIEGDANCYYPVTENYNAGVLSAANPATSTLAYTTGQGYDEATGIGSLNIANLVNNWQSTTLSTLYTPSVTVSPATTYTYGSPVAITYTAVVTGPGSLPTGSVSFAGSPIIGAIGSADALAGSAACATGGAVGTSGCYESTTQAYTPSATAVSAGSYTITATYSPTNENYISGTGTSSITVNKQTPGLTVTAPTATVAYGTASVVITAKLTYTGTGLAPTTAGLVTFQVGSIGTVIATCSGAASPLTCSYTFPLAGVSSGVYAITAAYAGDTNYSAVNASGTLTYGNASAIVFTVASPQHTMYPTVTAAAATSNSNGAITYSVVSGPATYQGLVSGKPTYLLTGTGLVTLRVSQAAATGSQTYTPTYSNVTFTVLAGSIWIGDNSNAVSTFDLLGNAIGGSGTGLTGAGIAAIASPLGEAFDATGYLWVASAAGVSEFSFPNPTAVSATPNTSGGISSPVALAIDGKSQVWVANNNGTISALTNAGSALSPNTGYTYSTVSSTAGGLSIDLSGNVWVTNSADNSVTEVVGAAAPISPPSTALANGTTGVEP